ncbi:MAG: hypothetical protein V2A79_07150 [Planctomycetota bacterium]
MLRRRKILLGFTIVVVSGSLSSTIGYALHLRGRSLRERIAADVSQLMGLHVEIGSVTPLSFSSRQFNDITVRLPQRETQLGRIGRAVWHAAEAGPAETYVLDLSDGWLLVGTGHWAASDYQRLLESGFGHDFAALHLTEINVSRVDFRWQHPALSMTAPAADGVISFDEQGKGRAVLTVRSLNEIAVDEPIHVSAWFTPGEGMAFQKVEVRLGDIPLRALGLDTLLDGPVATGTFAGQITYREGGSSRWMMEAGGSLRGARLEEWTGRVIGGPFRGAVDVGIDRAVFAPSADGRTRLQALRFSGRLADLQLVEFARLFREPELSGRIDLTVHQAEYERPDVGYVRLSGQATGVSLGALTHLLGYGVVTGRLEVRINALAVVDNVVQFADLELLAVPPEGAPAFIEKGALVMIGHKVFGLDLESILPDRVEYVRMGVKLLLDREGLRIRGTHGPAGDTILTIRLFGREVGILRQPDRVFPVENPIALLRSRLRSYDAEQLINWWKQHGDPAEGTKGMENGE